ncbi:MAG: hypothetical protein ABW117_07120, partial [Candidatus Sedimenticola sp. 1PA]
SPKLYRAVLAEACILATLIGFAVMHKFLPKPGPCPPGKIELLGSILLGFLYFGLQPGMSD